MSMSGFEPAHIALFRNGELKKRAEAAFARQENCDLCARYCRVNRLKTLQGVICGTGEYAVVDNFGPHHGEEAPLSGWRGSGTIFFSWCNLRCAFCQNWEISQKGVGRGVTPEEIAEMMLLLQAQGCHNINFVSPSHVVPQILAAVHIAADRGLRLPLVYNTGGYDSLEALALLDGVIDIYMPDMKYADPVIGRRYSKALHYPEINRAAIKEMHRQVGDLVWDDNGIAQRGLLVRHLVLPEDFAGSEESLSFIAREVSRDACVNIMDQYRPCNRAVEFPPLNRGITRQEFDSALNIAAKYGLRGLGPLSKKD
jgi:putative pyruvate formate lyase activating enzyme